MEDPQAIIHFWQTVCTASLTILVTLIGFWAGIARKMITREEISRMVVNDTPYAKDREFIMEKLASNKEAYMALSITLQKVVEVMSELKIQLSILSNSLNNLEDRIEDTIEDHQDETQGERTKRRTTRKPLSDKEV